MHLPPHTVTHKHTHNRHIVRFNVLLDCVTNIAEPIARLGLLDSTHQCVVCNGQQLLRFLGTLTDDERRGRIGDVSIALRGDVHFYHVALLDLSGPGDAVDYLLVHRNADVAGETEITLRGGDRATFAELIGSNSVEVCRAHPGLCGLLKQPTRARNDFPRFPHDRNLARRFEDDSIAFNWLQRAHIALRHTVGPHLAGLHLAL